MSSHLFILCHRETPRFVWDFQNLLLQQLGGRSFHFAQTWDIEKYMKYVE